MATVNAQIAELNSIRRTVYELENQQAKIRREYEDELQRLRTELATIRQSTHPAGPLGIHSLPSNSGTASANNDSINNSNNSVAPYGEPPPHSSSGRSRDLPLDARGKELQEPRGVGGRGGEPSSRAPPRDYDMDQSRERELDRLTDQRDPKRMKKRDASGEQRELAATVRL